MVKVSQSILSVLAQVSVTALHSWLPVRIDNDYTCTESESYRDINDKEMR